MCVCAEPVAFTVLFFSCSFELFVSNAHLCVYLLSEVRPTTDWQRNVCRQSQRAEEWREMASKSSWDRFGSVVETGRSVHQHNRLGWVNHDPAVVCRDEIGETTPYDRRGTRKSYRTRHRRPPQFGADRLRLSPWAWNMDTCRLLPAPNT